MNQKRWIKITIIFFVIMLIFTIMSRGVHNLSLAKVSVVEVTDGNISHNLSLSGMVTGNKNLFIMLPENIMIEDVFISSSDEVEVGTSLFSVEKTSLDKIIEELQKTVKKEQKQKSNAINRATQDYNETVDLSNSEINNAWNEYNNAVNSLNDYKSNHSPSDTPNYYEEVKNLESEVTSTKKTYEDANNNASKNIKDANRSLEDAKLDNDSYELDKKEKLLNDYLKIKSDNYQVISDKQGIVTKMDLNVGDKTQEGSYIILSDKESAGKVEIEISKDEAKYITKKSKVTLTGTSKNGEYVELNDLKISVKKSKASQDKVKGIDDEGYTINIALKDKEFSIGDDVHIDIENKSKEYDTTIPIEALHQDENNNFFVYIIEEKDTVLGKELVAVKVNVKIEDKNDETVALKEGAIGCGEKVILETNKKVENGSNIKIRED